MTQEHSHRFLVCGADEIAGQRSHRLTHIVTVTNPGVPSSKPDWFKGDYLQLWFGDVVSEADARRCKTRAPALEDVRSGLQFARGALKSLESRILVTCGYGASRSPALAYVFLADQLGPGREDEALGIIMRIRPNAVPNRLVIQLGDELLKRNGALLRPLNSLYTKINQELSEGR
jgi:predicted protein tyrosine phosphatase